MNQEEIMQQLQAALQAYLGKDLDSAENIFKQILSVNPKEPNALHLLGCIHKDRGQLQQAVELIQASIREDGTNSVPFLNLGKILSIAGQHENAAAAFQESLKRDRQIPETWFCFGNALKEMDLIQEAKQSFVNALQLNPAHARAASNLGALLTNDGELDEAEQMFLRSIDKSPNHVNLRINYASLLSKKGQHAAAIVQFQTALPLAPHSPELHYNFANALRVEGDIKRAIEHYQKAIEVKPDFAEAYLILGNVLKEEGEIKKAIASYRKAIEVKPDFVEAYLILGNAFKEDGEFEEARQIVSKLYQIKSPVSVSLITIQDKILVFDWDFRRTLDLSISIEFTAALIKADSLSCLSVVRQVHALCLPPLFFDEQRSLKEAGRLYEKGYLVDEGLVSEELCAQLVSQFNNQDDLNNTLIKVVLANGLLRTILERISLHTGLPHLIWNCLHSAKGPDDESVSDAWHYDNHYNIWTPKLMIYLNSQLEEGGATHFVDAGLSRQISEKSNYTGMIWQREYYADLVSGLVEELNLNPLTLDPEYYVFSPEKTGSGVWFCPSRSLHRGVSPTIGVRHVLTFSLTPLPKDCGWTVDQCVKKSVEILHDTFKNGMQRRDINPFWISAEFCSN